MRNRISIAFALLHSAKALREQPFLDNRLKESFRLSNSCQIVRAALLAMQAQIRMADEEAARSQGLELWPCTENCVPGLMRLSAVPRVARSI